MLQFFRGKKKHSDLIIAIGGKKRAGKNIVVANLMLSFAPDEWFFCSTSDILINTLASQITYATGKKTTPDDIRGNKEKYRKALQNLGDRWEAQEEAKLLKTALFTASGKPRVICESIRRQSEYEYVKSIGAQLVLVEASDETRKARGVNPDDEHPTEHEGYELLKQDKDTWVIPNNGEYEELKKEVARFTEFYKDRYWY